MNVLPVDIEVSQSYLGYSILSYLKTYIIYTCIMYTIVLWESLISACLFPYPPTVDIILL